MNRAGNRAGEINGPIAPNPISPQTGTTWLYVPRAGIVIPAGGTFVETFYYLNENGIDRFLSEDGLNIFRQEG